MDERIAKLKTSIDARKLAENAGVRGFSELAAQALNRAKELQALEEGFTTPAQQAIASALYAYEEKQSELTGRRFHANRTRQMLSKYGSLAAAERMVLSRHPSKGFDVLEDAGLKALTFESIIDRFPEEFSTSAIEAARARLEGRPPPPAASVVSPESSQSSVPDGSQVQLDAEIRAFLDGFADPSAGFLSQWLPRYRITVQAIAEALAEDRADQVFDLVWRTVDNSISNVGQGVLKFDVVDRMHDELLQVIRDIFEDGSPESYDRIVERFEGWRRVGSVPIVPRLMIARAFAGVHPLRYHTTVDARSQNQILAWFVEHTGLVMPSSASWAVRASVLVGHLDRFGVFGEDFLVRNMFPWFVMDQLRALNAPQDIPPGHHRRPDTTFADLPAHQRTIRLRHNVVQDALYDKLASEFGANKVWTEYPTGTGG